MKIFGKKIGSKFLNIVFGGKPKTIETKSSGEMDELVSLVKKSNEGDLEAINELKQKLFKKETELLKQLDSNNSEQISKQIEKFEEKETEISKKIESKKQYESLLNSNVFDVVDNKVYLKGFKAELPPILIDKFVEELSLNKDITDLVDFWKLNLTNENPEARRGLYNFIKKQKLLIAKHGYFIAFRRVFLVNKVEVNGLSEKDSTYLNDYVTKVKKWKKSLKSFEVFKTQGSIIIKQIKQGKNIDGESLGSLYDFVNNTKSGEVFTDARTRKMVIKIGEPVSIPRSECNKNANIECSFGLHVGSQSFVDNNPSFGDTIVACLVNPQHVISVPYSDAHKMRVCEYLPFMKLTKEQLRSFHTLDTSKYSIQYKNIESDKLKSAYDVLDTLSKSELSKFATESYDPSVSEEDLQKVKDQKTKLEVELKQVKKQLNQVLGDDISQELDLQEIKEIIKSRIS